MAAREHSVEIAHANHGWSEAIGIGVGKRR